MSDEMTSDERMSDERMNGEISYVYGWSLWYGSSSYIHVDELGILPT